MRNIVIVLGVLGLSFFIFSCSQEVPSKPNILLIMVDDLGFSDFGCYGSEIQTPHIDKLADNGLRFTQFYNTAKCHSSRVSLLSGLYCVQAGDRNLNRATTIAEVLGNAGYFTSMAGKWHLTKEPTDFGFQRYWGHLSGMTDFFTGDSTFRYNGEPWDDFDEDFYTTDANVDFSIEFLEEALVSGKPFFHYLAFNAPHYPLQAPKSEIEKYMGTYDPGWEVIREARFEKQKLLGIFPETMELPGIPSHMPSWSSLSEEQKEFESFRMSVFSAMVDKVDQNLGRLIAFLEEKGELENTLILLCSDNGGCPFERSRNNNLPPWEGDSYLLYDASWATVSNTPLRHYKQTQHEGGISSPMIVHWPGKIQNKGGWDRSTAHLMDVMATCIDVAGTTYPESESVEPLQGKSLLPLLRGEERSGYDDLYFRFNECRALRSGDWKLVSFYRNRWELYNIAEDRAEQNDLADQYPDRVKQLSDRWHEMAEHTDQLKEKDRLPVTDLSSPNNRDEWHRPELVKDWEIPLD